MMSHTEKQSNLSAMDAAAAPFLFYTMLLFVFLCPFIYIKGLYNYVTLPQSAVVQVGSILFLILFFFAYAVSKKKIWVNPHPLNLAVLCFSAWTLISSVYAHNHYESFDQWAHWSACILFFFLLQSVIASEHRALTVLAVIYAAGLITAIIGIGQYLLGIDIIPQSAPPSATFANKNMAAQFITLTFPLAIALLCGSKQKTTTWFAAISAAVMIIFLVYARTRAAWVAVCFELILIIAVLLNRSFRNKIQLFRNKEKMFASFAGMFLILLFMNIGPEGFKWQLHSVYGRVVSVLDYRADTAEPPSLPGTLPSAVNELKKTPTGSGHLRLSIWKNTLEMIKEKPLTGYGLGNHKVYYPLFHAKAVKEQVFSETRQLSNVHNDFLQLLSETGVIGVILVVFVFLLFFRLTADVCRTRVDSVFFAAMGAGISVAGILVNSCFSFPFEMPIPPLILMVYLSVALCLSQKTGAYGITVSGKWLIVLILILMPVFCYSVRYYYLDIKCDRYYLQAKIFEKRNKWKSVSAIANRAYALNPNRKKILSYSARGHIESGEYQKGINALQHVIRAYPYHMNALLNLGAAHSGLKQYGKAMEYYQKALEIKPDFSKAHINMAGIYMGRKQYDKAVDSFQKAAVNDPDNIMILYNMGISQVHLKAYEQAAQTLEKTVGLKPDWANAQLNLAILYYQYLDKKRKSIPHFKKALELNPNVRNKNQIKKIIELFSDKN